MESSMKRWMMRCWMIKTTNYEYDDLRENLSVHHFFIWFTLKKEYQTTKTMHSKRWRTITDAEVRMRGKVGEIHFSSVDM